jgi:hypothetical protein
VFDNRLVWASIYAADVLLKSPTRHAVARKAAPVTKCIVAKSTPVAAS